MSKNSVASNGAAGITKDDLIWRVQHLNDQALFARSCDTLARQFCDNKESYPMAILKSASFYFVSYQAWMYSSSMSLAKLYESDGLQDLLKQLRVHKDLFSHEDPLTKRFTPAPAALQTIHNSYNRFLNKKLKASTEKLRLQRNKVWEHNDAETNFDLRLVYSDEFGLSREERNLLLEFAVSLTSFCRFALTGNVSHNSQDYTDDWGKTIELVETYRDHSHDALLKEFGVM